MERVEVVFGRGRCKGILSSRQDITATNHLGFSGMVQIS
jgi:hypothetical protein